MRALVQAYEKLSSEMKLEFDVMMQNKMAGVSDQNVFDPFYCRLAQRLENDSKTSAGDIYQAITRHRSHGMFL